MRVRHFTLAALAALVAGVVPTAGAQPSGRPLAPARVAAQVGLGVVATPVAFVASGVLAERLAERLGVDDPRASRVALTAAWAGAALGTAAGPALVGARGPGRGSYAAALGGAVAGGLASWALVRLNDREGDDPRPPCRVLCALSAVAVFTLPAVGGTVGYNLSR